MDMLCQHEQRDKLFFRLDVMEYYLLVWGDWTPLIEEEQEREQTKSFDNEIFQDAVKEAHIMNGIWQTLLNVSPCKIFNIGMTLSNCVRVGVRLGASVTVKLFRRESFFNRKGIYCTKTGRGRCYLLRMTNYFIVNFIFAESYPGTSDVLILQRLGSLISEEMLWRMTIWHLHKVKRGCETESFQFGNCCLLFSSWFISSSILPLFLRYDSGL